MYHNGTKETVCIITTPTVHFVPPARCCDPAVVKVDERKKLCLTTHRFIYYNNF